MITKHIDLSDRSFLSEGEESVVVPFIYANASVGYEPNTRYKSATQTGACEEAIEFASKIRPEQGKRIILVSAVGAYETWGPNKKADAFPEAAILGLMPRSVDLKIFERFGHKIPKKWGHECFPTILDKDGNQIGGGNTFYEHNNRVVKFGGQWPPLAKGTGMSAADPRCGNILFSVYNKKKKRVECIQEVREDKLARVCGMIDDGILPGISMACDIPFDRCSKCQNLAPTEMDYCRCLQRSGGQRGYVLEDGTIVVMINDMPVFFDSTITFNRAAYEAGTLRKLASFQIPFSRGNQSHITDFDEIEYMPLSMRKIASMAKDASEAKLGLLQSHRLAEPSFGDELIEALRLIPLLRLVKYLGLLGMYPTGTDLAKLLFGLKQEEAHTVGQQVEGALAPLVTRHIPMPSNPLHHRTIIMKVGSADERGFDIDEFSRVGELVKEYLPLKSYHPTYFLRRKASSLYIDLHKPLYNIGDDARTLLLSRMLMDRGMMQKLLALVVNPLVQLELEKYNINGSSIAKHSLPIYDKESEGHKPDLDKIRLDKFMRT